MRRSPNATPIAGLRIGVNKESCMNALEKSVAITKLANEKT
jgi:hypothetical protein